MLHLAAWFSDDRNEHVYIAGHEYKYCNKGYYYYWSLLYSAILRSRADSLCSHVILHEWIAFYSVFFLNIHRSGVQCWHGWCHRKLLPSRRILCTPYNHAPCHFMQSHIHKVYACLAVACHLHFWQNDRDLLRATAVTLGWNGHRNKSQHRKADRGEENSLAAHAGTRTRDLSITSPAL